jgi:hypothetical protein
MNMEMFKRRIGFWRGRGANKGKDMGGETRVKGSRPGALTTRRKMQCSEYAWSVSCVCFLFVLQFIVRAHSYATESTDVSAVAAILAFPNPCHCNYAVDIFRQTDMPSVTSSSLAPTPQASSNPGIASPTSTLSVKRRRATGAHSVRDGHEVNEMDGVNQVMLPPGGALSSGREETDISSACMQCRERKKS